MAHITKRLTAFGLLVKMAIEENCRRLVVSGCRDIEEKGRRTSRFGQHLENGIRKKALSPLCRLAASLPQKAIDLPIDIEILGFARDPNIVLKFGKRFALPSVLHDFLNRPSGFVILDGSFRHLCGFLLNNSPLKREGFLRPSTDFSTRSDPA